MSNSSNREIWVITTPANRDQESRPNDDEVIVPTMGCARYPSIEGHRGALIGTIFSWESRETGKTYQRFGPRLARTLNQGVDVKIEFSPHVPDWLRGFLRQYFQSLAVSQN